MSSPEALRILRLGLAASLALLLAGCFRPVYGDRSAPGVASKSEGADVERRLKTVDVRPIEGRVGGKMRNELIFLLRGGAAAEPVAYRLDVRLVEDSLSAIVDPLTSVPETRTVSLRAHYTLTRAGSLDPVMTSDSFATATYFGGLQRFAIVRAERDAQDRAAIQIAERIRTRLQGYFATGR